VGWIFRDRSPRNRVIGKKKHLVLTRVTMA
jgi:hypothetical protein